MRAYVARSQTMRITKRDWNVRAVCAKFAQNNLQGSGNEKGRSLTPAHRFENTLVDEVAAVFLIDPCQDVSHVLGSTEIECCSVFLRSPCTLASTSPRFGGSFIRSTHNVKNLVI